MAFFPNSNGGGLPAGNSPLAGVGGVLTPLGMNGGGMDGGGFSPAFATGMHGAFPLALQQPAVRDIQMGNSGEVPCPRPQASLTSPPPERDAELLPR